MTGEISSAVTEMPGIVRSVQYRHTGINLSIKPVINARGVITLEISQEISEPQSNTTSGIDSPLILNRQIKTEVVAADGQTIVLGGLIKENVSNQEKSVPVLGKIPILGLFFKDTSVGKDRTELLVVLTPRILQSKVQADAALKEIVKGFSQIGL